MSDETIIPGFRGLIERIVDERMRVVSGPQPGQVVSWDKAKQRASIQPLVQRVYEGEDGKRATRLPAVVQDVPVLFLGGAGGRITVGLATGDLVLLIPLGVSTARWLARGGKVDPGEARGSISDSVAIAGLHNFASVPTEAPDGAVTVHSGDIRLGSKDAADPVIRKSDLTTFFNQYKAHTHLDPVSGSTGVPSNAGAVTLPSGSPNVRID